MYRTLYQAGMYKTALKKVPWPHARGSEESNGVKLSRVSQGNACSDILMLVRLHIMMVQNSVKGLRQVKKINHNGDAPAIALVNSC